MERWQSPDKLPKFVCFYHIVKKESGQPKDNPLRWKRTYIRRTFMQVCPRAVAAAIRRLIARPSPENLHGVRTADKTDVCLAAFVRCGKCLASVLCSVGFNI